MFSTVNWKRILAVILTVSLTNSIFSPALAVKANELESQNSIVNNVQEVREDVLPEVDVTESPAETENLPEVNVTEGSAETETVPEVNVTEGPTETAPVPEDGSLENPTETEAPVDENAATENTTSPQVNNELYQDGYVLIYNEKQLKAIGSGSVVYAGDKNEDTFGTGETVADESGAEVRYALDGTYRLMNDISLNGNAIWTLPENFTGKFVGGTVEDTAPLYDSAKDTIYVYHNYQLVTIASEQSEQEPVMSNDKNPAEFGMGNLLYKDGTPADESQEAAQDYLTYAKSHKYVLSKNFTEQMPELLANVAAGTTYPLEGENPDGRTYPGQVVYTDSATGKDYILIGNETQLRAIGSNQFVNPRLYIYKKPGLITGLFGADPLYVPYYPGDADLGLEAMPTQGATFHGLFKEPDVVKQDKGYTYQSEKPEGIYKLAGKDLSNPKLLEGILGGLGHLLGGLTVGDAMICGVNDQGLPDHHIGQSKVKDQVKGMCYTSDANYIIFRDIDLSVNGKNSNQADDNWNPILLSGNMEGRLGMVDGSPVTISNITVSQTGKLDPSTTRGLGFFGSISSQIDENEFGHSKGTTLVEDLHLKNVSIDNQSTEVKPVDMSLVKILLGTVGGLLGGVLGIVEDILGYILPGLDLKLSDVVKDLLTVQAAQPDIFAVGSFAGRIVGDVKVQNCTVEQASVSNVKDMTGGFVGYTEGIEKYDGLSKLLGGTVKVLSKLLNVIPGIGLGDLITVLLKNAVNLGELIPVGYYKPTIENCSVALSKGAVGTSSTNYNGGFVGMQTATNMTGCTVQNLSSVQANIGAGGFAGIARDAVIQSLLTSLGVDFTLFDIKSKQEGCSVASSALSVLAADQYAGGFNGLMANSVSKNSGVTGLQMVGAKRYAGGFTGRATIGYGVTIGGDEKKDNTLLKAVKKLLVDLVAPGNEDKLNTLLALSGLTPSELHECAVSGTNWKVEATESYAGGLFGQGDGAEVSLAQRAEPVVGTPEVLDANPTVVKGLASVSAKNYAGGIAGSVVTANPIGVLNETLGVGSYLPFRVAKVNLEGSNLKVTATEEYAAGGLGLMLGGKVQQVNISGIADITARNYTGGLAGRAGSGSLVREGGLDLLGLGLIKVDNVLSLAQGVNVKVEDTYVTGIEQGAVISATGVQEPTSKDNVLAGGLISEAEGIQISDTNVSNIKEVKAEKGNGAASYAGGFVGQSHTGGLAGIAQKEDGGKLTLPGIVDISSLLSLVPYLVPEYTNCKTTFVSNGENPQVMADYAGGFFGNMNSGKVDNSAAAAENRKAYAVAGLENVKGADYAGGFAGKIEAGAVAASNGLKLLGGIVNLDISNLLSVLNVYIPVIESAGVQSAGDGKDGFIVEATAVDSSAGGYAGQASGATIQNSDVACLKHTSVNAPSDLEAADASSYYNGSSVYAVKAGRYAGGFVGRADIDSAAQVGGGLKVANILDLNNLLSALDVVATEIKDCNVHGGIGGFSVLANGTDAGATVGKAGGFVGESSGSQIKNSDVYNFAYIIGQEMAGGYAGHLEPGNVAAVLGEDQDILNGLVGVQDTLASLVNAFIPIVKNSQTTAIPCGGVVRAQGTTDADRTRGMAGGFVGYNHGGKIDGTEKECAVVRLRSVYGTEAAGGFTGLMENADLAGTGNLKLLFGLVKVSNVLSLLNAVYPTETHTAVYGPLRQMDVDTWNAWADAVASKGVYGYQFPADKVANQDELNTMIPQYAYGYNVKAGRSEVGSSAKQIGDAGGYVGKMEGGVITEAHAWDAKDIIAYKSAGGFAGEMVTGGVANVGSISLIGQEIPISGKLSALETFVPVIRNSDVTGFQSGLSVTATGTPQQGQNVEKVGYAGGYVGHVRGGQIWGNWNQAAAADTFSVTDAVEDTANDKCFVANLRRVNGTNTVGGYAGLVEPGATASVDTASKEGLLGGLLQSLIGAPGDLAEVLNATMSTIKAADVKPWDAYGIVVDGVYSEGTATKYAKAVGGFAGELQGTVIGDKDSTDLGVTAEGVRSVTGGKHVGGFFGYADVSSVAEVSNSEGSGQETSILGTLIGLGSIKALDAFRTFIYDSKVSGVIGDGLTVEAKEVEKYGFVNDPSFTGNAGGFGGSLRNGSVKRCTVENLRDVEGKNYVGGFIGHMDKGGVLDLENASLLDKFLSAGGDVLGAFGCHVDDSKVIGIPEGFAVGSHNPNAAADQNEIVGGFVGFADIARMQGNTVENLREVSSGQTAGGFAGQTSYTYLANIKLDSPLVNQVVKLLNELLKQLWIQDIQTGGGIQVNLGFIKVDVISQGDLLHVNLFGLDIGIELVKDQSLARIHIGDSVIEVNCANDGSIQKPEDQNLKNEINISLIKANRTKIDGCSVTGIESGYNVYGGGADTDQEGTGKAGYTGGFVGYNDEGLLKNNTMDRADVIKGTPKLVGEFVGKTSLNTINTAINDIQKIEGENNLYYVYRQKNPAKVEDDHLDAIFNGTQKLNVKHENAVLEARGYDKYQIQHRNPKDLHESDSESLHKAVWENADLTRDTDQTIRIPAKVYVNDGQADLMLGRDTAEVPDYAGKLPGEVQDPCATGAGITIHKIWIDNDNKGNTRPNQIDIQLTRNGAQFKKFNMNSSMMEQDPSIWTTTIEAPAKDEEGKSYIYDVTEKPIDGYATIYKKSDDGYTLYIYNYLVSDLLRKDTVVIDYGLPVDIDVLTNDKLVNAETEVGVKATLSGVTTTKLQPGTAGVPAGTEATGKYGTANVLRDAVRYTPNTMEMDSLERLYYEVQITEAGITGSQKYAYGEVTVIPATEIYYEDNFSAITYTDGKQKDGTPVRWETVGDSTQKAQVQDTDRPSKDRLLRDWDDWYGNDSHYTDDATFSNGTTHKVTITPQISKKGAVKPKMEFKFTGTGFDVISLTSGASGMLQMRVYDSENKLVQAENKDTYYGYKLVDGKWEVDTTAKASNALYQVPVLRATGLEYGTYRVELIPTYITALDVAGKDQYDVYIDAIRIYDPVDASNPNDADYQEIEGVYNVDGENHPKYKEIREILLNANKISELDQNGAVFVDGKGSVTDMKEYESYGPKHEVYLAPGQAISFTLWANEIPDRVRVSGKLAMGSDVKLSVAAGVKTDSGTNGWKSFRKADHIVKTAHDMFYDFTEQCIWEKAQTPNGNMMYKTRYPVVIMNTSPVEAAQGTSNNILSLTNLKWTGSTGSAELEGPSGEIKKEMADNSIELDVTVNQDNVLAAYALLNEKPEKTIRVQYQTLAGEMLGEEKVFYQEEGSSYDVAKWLDQEIAGYTKIDVSGDAVQGTLDQDKVIKVVYGKNYTLNIHYQDQSGKDLSEPVTERIVEGTTYDLTERCNRDIEGYTATKIKGDDIQGTVLKDLNLVVVYEKESINVPEETDPVAPETTDPAEPEETDPVAPETTDPTVPEETDPVVPEKADPTVSDETDPTTSETTPEKSGTKPATGDKKPAADNQKLVTGDKKPVVDNQKPTTGETESATDETKLTTDETVSIANETKPGRDATQPGTDDEEQLNAVNEDSRPAEEKENSGAMGMVLVTLLLAAVAVIGVVIVRKKNKRS